MKRVDQGVTRPSRRGSEIDDNMSDGGCAASSVFCNILLGTFSSHIKLKLIGIYTSFVAYHHTYHTYHTTY